MHALLPRTPEVLKVNLKKFCLALSIIIITAALFFSLSSDPASAGSIVQETSSGFGNANNVNAYSMAVYNGRVYVGTNEGVHGCEVWASNGTGWIQVVGQGAPGSPTAPGFGSANNYNAQSMAAFGNYLYVGTGNGTGGRGWRYDGANWVQVVGAGAGGAGAAPGFGNAANSAAFAMQTTRRRRAWPLTAKSCTPALIP